MFTGVRNRQEIHVISNTNSKHVKLISFASMCTALTHRQIEEVGLGGRGGGGV
jgi:hypothetical protein